MRAELKELWRFRELLWAMVERELRIRYKNSLLGFFWSLLNPLVTVLVITVVFKFFLQNGTNNYSAYVLAAYLPFMFFQVCIMDSAQSVLGAVPIIKKVYFPREILPLSNVIANFIHFLLALCVYFVYLFVLWGVTGFATSPFTWKIFFLPVLLIVNFALAAGVSFFVSAYNVFYEDVKYVVGVALYLMFFLTPVMYFSETVYYALKAKGMVWAYYLYHLNPVATLSTAYRKTLVPTGMIEVKPGPGQAPVQMYMLDFDWTLFWIAVAVSLVLLVTGYAAFNKLKWRFVERP
ncbi:MAG TPA: ABC transporter permease [Fimbriimonadaceae bacterium]|nr:ABC transporter permease [Fimbriimonadaceae bacterium]